MEADTITANSSSSSSSVTLSSGPIQLTRYIIKGKLPLIFIFFFSYRDSIIISIYPIDGLTSKDCDLWRVVDYNGH